MLAHSTETVNAYSVSYHRGCYQALIVRASSQEAALAYVYAKGADWAAAEIATPAKLREAQAKGMPIATAPEMIPGNGTPAQDAETAQDAVETAETAQAVETPAETAQAAQDAPETVVDMMPSPETRFGSYTKSAEILDALGGAAALPSNLSMQSSPWIDNGVEIAPAYPGLPQFRVDDGTDPIAAAAPHCPAVAPDGSRTGITCKQCGHCYRAKAGEIWAVYKHA